MTTILNLGAGVQSTTLLLMCLKGEWPMPDHVVFADTGWEPAPVYQHLEWLKSLAKIDVVSAGDSREEISRAAREGKFIPLPLYAVLDGVPQMLRRQCARQYKISPLQRYARKATKEHKVDQAEVWIAFSLDELHRMKAARVGYVKHRWPLIEKGMTRGACIQWLRHNGHDIPPKSSCVPCPFHSDAVWRTMRDSSPADWEEAVKFDKLIRCTGGIEGECYLHHSLKPLGEVDLSLDTDRGQMLFFECMGICGT